jgi:hypothetical protein
MYGMFLIMGDYRGMIRIEVDSWPESTLVWSASL